MLPMPAAPPARFEVELHPATADAPWRATLRPLGDGLVMRFESPQELVWVLSRLGQPALDPRRRGLR